ncbi:DUF559 domain-containing protein [Demequina sp. NBRC 110052]|uniref:DUF559 domain-containing protein n=1 Tax=Demequina sp. NBRC 110052 TaxID=1570341 RepID=UPI000A05369A|nr:DUF559 domain-containing protein [Demequina sp. NBRC 110052]
MARAARDGVESFLELRGGSILRGPVLSQCVRQHRLCVGERTFRVDAFHVPSAVAIEFDGEAFHGSSEQRRRDRERDVILASAGVQTLRFGYAEVRDDARHCRELAEATVRARMGSTVGA